MIPNGTRVLVNGEHDNETFENEYGTVVQSDLPHHQLVRFDTPRDAFHTGNDGEPCRHWYFKSPSDCLVPLVAPSTYLNGLDIEFPSATAAEKARKFSEGDTIRLINDKDTAAKYGATARVIGYEKSSWDDSIEYVRIVWDRNELSGSQNDGGYSDRDFALVVAEDARPRFMTAYLVPDERVFVPTGDAFMTKEAADAGALETLKENEVADQIAVLELRTVHMARLTITSEAA